MGRVRTKTGGIPYARYQLQRAILENALVSNYTTEDYEASLEFFGGCAFCGERKVSRKDHLIPVRKNGDFIRRNVVPACQKCDDSKGQKDFRDWMRSANSPKSLKIRGLTEKDIEQRIEHIERWQSGYRAKTEKELFGKYYNRYTDILKKMDDLCEEARQLIKDTKTQMKYTVTAPATSSRKPIFTKIGGTTADRIRQFVLDNYVNPARSRDEKSIKIRSGDIHAQMQLHQQHANVCQVLRGNIFHNIAGVKVLSIRGPLAGGNTYFTYKILNG
ncbi:MAG: hypothetical protein D4R38_01825 [Dehalococcoidia bacterium]|nr:MAG: hypothetical protein D4R38_01825 [Dehalococcoidia bacterium]